MAINLNAIQLYDFSIFDLIDNAVFVVNESNGFVYGNVAFEVAIGLTSAEIQKHIIAINAFLKFSLSMGILELDVGAFIHRLKRKTMKKRSLEILGFEGVTFQKYALSNKKYITGFIVIVDQIIIFNKNAAAKDAALKICPPKKGGERLTRRELQVLRLLASGYLTKQIAYHLGNSIYTIANHQKSIYKKLRANSKIAAIIEAKKQGLLSF